MGFTLVSTYLVRACKWKKKTTEKKEKKECEIARMLYSSFTEENGMKKKKLLIQECISSLIVSKSVCFFFAFSFPRQ